MGLKMAWSEHLFKKSTKQRDGNTTPNSRKLKHVMTPGKFGGLAVGNLEKYNLTKTKKK